VAIENDHLLPDYQECVIVVNLKLRSNSMNQQPSRMPFCALLTASVLATGLICAAAPEDPAAAAAVTQRDGQHDFDFELGSWTIHLKRLLHPLTGSTEWAEFDGTSVTRKIWDGRANLEEFETNGPTGRVEGLTLRLYDPETRLWSLYWANGKDGALSLPPTVGGFRDSRGEFYDHEIWHGKAIFVRYIWSNIAPDSAHFEQSFSDDGGRTWEVNWITDQKREKQ
jgi:hypothetical protein